VSTTQRAIELLAKLVAFDTTSRNCNLELAAFVEDYLATEGVASTRHDYVAGCKTNLHASIGPAATAGVVLSGHTDVVPVDGQPWTCDPFRLTERGSRLVARGSCDMKGFIAVALAMVPEFRARRLRTPIEFAFSCDEEVGCRGVVPLVHSLAARRPPPALVIVGEPSSMRVLDAHKGNLTFVTEVTGAEAHSGNPARGVNAITYAARLVVAMEREAQALSGVIDPSGRFDPPYSTLHVGVISGGTAKNIVPGHCTITWEMRPLPGADLDRVLASLRATAHALEMEMKAVEPRACIETRRLNSVPPLEADPVGRARRFVGTLTDCAGVGAASFATEAGHFQVAGMPAVICGPGSIDQAHRADEYIERGELDACVAFMRRLADACEAGVEI
jgi:acetylornithine deacetylase